MKPEENLLHQMTQEVIDAIFGNRMQEAKTKWENTWFYLQELVDYCTTDEDLVQLKKYDVLLSQLKQKIR